MQGSDSQLNVYNLTKMREATPRVFEFIRFDPNNTCNLRCCYCHNHRSEDVIEAEELSAFIEQNVIRVENFQVGCIMEPTLDPRLADLMLLIGESKAKPRRELILQTNGILLFRHDYAKMKAAGLSSVCVSIDSANPETMKYLRGGVSLAKIEKSLAAFRDACPEIPVTFVSTVTRINLDEMVHLVRFGLGVGVRKFILRAIFYQPESDIVDHSKMPALVLQEGDFERMKRAVLERYEGNAEFLFADNETLDRSGEKMKADSFR